MGLFNWLITNLLPILFGAAIGFIIRSLLPIYKKFNKFLNQNDSTIRKQGESPDTFNSQ